MMDSEGKNTRHDIQTMTGEISDLIGRPSIKLVILSKVLICVVLAGFVLGGLYMKCPQTVLCDIELSSSVSASGVICGISGWVVDICVEGSGRLSKDSPVAIVRNDTGDYPIISPIDGTFDFAGPLSKNQFVAQGTLIGYVLPDETGDVSGWSAMQESSVSQLRVGDRCLVSLDRYPVEDYGTLEGFVAGVGKIPMADGRLVVKTEFPHGMTTSLGKRLECRGKLRGSVSIIVRDRKLMDIVLQPFSQFMNENDDSNSHY